MNKWLSLALLTAFLAITFIVGCNYGKMRSETQEASDTMIVSDTVWKTDSFEVIKPIPKYIKVVKTDTITKDTVLTKESKTYSNILCNEGDSIQLQTTISGYEASLDSVSAKWKKQNVTKTEYITVTNTIKEKKKINIGLQVGYGIGLKDKEFQPYIGLGLQYNF